MGAQWVYVGDPSGPQGVGGAAQILAVHAALLPIGPAGKIVYFSGSGWVEPKTWESIEGEPDRTQNPKYLAARREIDHSRLYDCATRAIGNLGSPDADLFCSGHAFLPDGRLMVAGGTQHFPPPEESRDLHHAHWSGSRESWIFDPFATVKAAPGATVTALWSPVEAGHLDLFMTGPDGVVRSAWHDPAAGWLPWFPIHPETKGRPGAAVTALWSPVEVGHLDLFVTGVDGTVLGAWHDPAAGWLPWFPISQGPPWEPGPLLGRDPDQVAAGPGGMGGGRWYPTLITLADGRVFAICGHPLIERFTGNLVDFDARHNNTKPEVYDPRSNAWTLINKPLGVDGAHNFAPYYPRLHLVPHTGEVFCVQPLYSGEVRAFVPGNPLCGDTAAGGDGLCTDNPLDTEPPYAVPVKDMSLFYDVASRDVTRAFLGPQATEAIYLDPLFTSQETTSVLLPLLHEEGYHPRVLVAGGVRSLVADLASAAGTSTTTSTTPSLTWEVTAARPLSTVRNYANGTLLPTGDVAITGGVTKGIGQDHYTEADGVRAVEIYHPPGDDTADSWSLGPVARETRGYHSVALLMPDGRVWTAGSEWNASTTPNLAIELLEPDYIATDDRVIVTEAPGTLGYGRTFDVRFRPTTANTPIGRVAFLRLGSATHSFDGDQRYVGVPFTRDGDRLAVTSPPDATVAPPGYYMLWLIDQDNLPCKLAPFVKLGPD